MHQLAFVFPGQGSQSVGMLGELAHHYPLIKNRFIEASEILEYDLWELTQQGSKESLDKTEYTQTAMLTADVATFDLLSHLNFPKPKMLAGHSLGEYPALVCSQALSFKQALKLVRKRADLMQKAVPVGKGAMAAIIGLETKEVARLCASISTDSQTVEPANFNAIGQVVIAGHVDAVNQAVEKAKLAKAKLATILPVSVPCHCRLLKEVSVEFKECLKSVDFKMPQISVVSNVDASFYHDVNQIISLLSQQLYSPVQWIETIQLLAQKKINTIIECGPGKILNGLIKRIDTSFDLINVHDYQHLKNAEKNIITQCR